ncbi:hypothetical protein [Klebsiella pneumoniae]|uniref:hypothetical protein n=1 Tax=Klebsiella pneumoniae TaxID=573 RepID=UPI00388F45E9
MAIDEKQMPLAAALGQIEKQFGKGSIMRPGEDRTMDVETISTGSLLDIARWAPAVCQWAVSSRSTVRNPPVKPP